MGRRKLRFHIRKNYNRKGKQNQLIASQPPSVLPATSSVHQTDSETDIESPLQCIVKIPLSLYTSLLAATN